MKSRQDIGTGLVVLVFAIAGFIETRGLPTGAAMLPSAALIALMVLAVLMIARGVISARRPRADAPASPLVESPGRLGIGIVAMILYIVCIEILGFYVTTLLFVPLTAYALGIRELKTIALSAAGFVATIYLIFAVLFERILPTGIAFAILFGISSALEVASHA